ncbi:MAG: alpha-N-arabinofuranosidase, partial [Chitinophagaceae bacterium]|nr:alpha-N-arabinofuranosidase [Chitinophagaceae bacterium]
MKISHFIIFLFLGLSSFAQPRVVLHADSGKTRISRHIYGHFAEHLGRCIYDGIYVGDGNTAIPNVNGVRTDIIEALKKLKVPNLRWPGGCFADAYHWKDGIGPKKDRPSMVNRWWGATVEDNSFGTHEFLGLCEQIGAEAYLAGNVGSGTVQELSDWVDYTNIEPNKGPMGKLRVQNGREKPWNVRYWGVGNESWGCGGNMKPEYYAMQYRQYATFMADWDNSKKIFRVASGANGDDMNWTEVMMRDVPLNMMEGLSLHHYSVINWSAKGSAAQFDEATYIKTMKQAWKMDDIVTRHSAIMDKYDPRKRVALVVDEWGGWYEVEPGTNPGHLYQQNTMRDAMIAGLTLNIFNNHADRVRIANLAQTVNVLQAVILTDKEKMILTPTFHVMEMYNVHQDATLLPVEVNTPDYVYGDEKIPAVSVSASKNEEGITHISLVNVDASKKHEVAIDIKGSSFKSISGRILSS